MAQPKANARYEEILKTKRFFRKTSQKAHLIGLVEHLRNVFDVHLGVDALSVCVDRVHGEEDALRNLCGR